MYKLNDSAFPSYLTVNLTTSILGWLKSCYENKSDIIYGIQPFVEDSSSEIVTMFTFGSGTTNREREAYFVGWEIVQYILGEGVTFKEIASIQEKDISNYLREVYPLLN